MKLQKPKEKFHHYYTIANHYFLCEVSFSRLFQKCKMSLRRNFVAESIDPSANCSQQNLLNFKSAECLSVGYFIVENFRSQNVDLSTDYLRQNLLSSRMFIYRMFHSRKFQKPKCRYLNRLFMVGYSVAEYFTAEFCIKFQQSFSQNILPQNSA